MKLSAMLLIFGLSACTTTPEVVSNDPVERCDVDTCFSRLQVRNFEVLDNRSLLLYVGSQECPFLVEFDGTFCDLTFLPGFDIPWTFSSASRPTSGRTMNTRICSNDLDIGIADRVFTDAGGGRDAVGLGQVPCTIRTVRSLTDDEVLEAYVDNGIAAPPPPFGTGQIDVGEDTDAEEEEEGEATPEPSEVEPPAAAAAIR